MIKVNLKNPSDKDIIDYRIAEAQIDENGNTIVQTNSKELKTTGVTLEWSLMAGETKTFPKYVADYLINIYPFLEIVEETETKEKVKTIDAKPSQGIVSCKYCGQNFKNTRALALHIAVRHPEKIL